jgi:hypothetical protein
MKHQNVKVVPEDGRYLVCARLNPDTEWFPIESVSSAYLAESLADDLENDDQKRKEYIEDPL